MNDQIKLAFDLVDVVEVEDPRTQQGEKQFQEYHPLREFRGNYGVPRLVGERVVKGFFKSDAKTITMLRALHDAYIEELARFIPVVPTTIEGDGRQFYLTQPYIVGGTYDGLLRQPHQEREVVDAHKTCLAQALKFIVGSSRIVGIDGKPENWIRGADGEWMFLDTFPPFLIDADNTFGQIFNLRTFENEFSQTPHKSYFRNARKVARRLWLKAEKIDASIDYLSATVEVFNSMEDAQSKVFFEKMMRDYR
jgi:hypothetical protein